MMIINDSKGEYTNNTWCALSYVQIYGASLARIAQICMYLGQSACFLLSGSSFSTFPFLSPILALTLHSSCHLEGDIVQPI